MLVKASEHNIVTNLTLCLLLHHIIADFHSQILLSVRYTPFLQMLIHLIFVKRLGLGLGLGLGWKWEMENGKWKMENGKWKMENRKWKMENGK